jgi:hypothetical protein
MTNSKMPGDLENSTRYGNHQPEENAVLADFDFDLFLGTTSGTEDFFGQISQSNEPILDRASVAEATDGIPPSSGPNPFDHQEHAFPNPAYCHAQNGTLKMYRVDPLSQTRSETDLNHQLADYQMSLITNLNCRQRIHQVVSSENFETREDSGVKVEKYPYDDTVQWINPKQFERLRKRRIARFRLKNSLITKELGAAHFSEERIERGIGNLRKCGRKQLVSRI